jgi:hypothetical protein
MERRSSARSVHPAIAASALIFALIAALVVAVFSAISRIDEAKAMLRDLEEPWRAIWLESSGFGPGAEAGRAAALHIDLASFEARAADSRIRYLCKASQSFAAELAFLRARASSIVDSLASR